MDIKSKAVSSTAFCHFRDADDALMYEGDGRSDADRVGAMLYSPGSKQGQRALANQNNRMMDKIKQRGKTKQSAAEKLQEQAEFLADVTASFQNLSYPGQFNSSHELAMAVYSDAEIGFIADQAAKFFGEWGNFLPSAQNHSSST